MFRRTGSRIVNTIRRGPVTSMLVVGLLGAVLAATAIAATSSSGGSITAVKVVREEGTGGTTATSFGDVAGASTTITVPSGQRALIVARFEASSLCQPSETTTCIGRVRILIGGVEGAPGGTWDFDSANVGHESSGTRSIERSRGGFGGLPAGTYEVKVQSRVAFSGTLLALSGWHLTVETSRVG